MGITSRQQRFDFDIREVFSRLAAMELPTASDWGDNNVLVEITSPGGLGEILLIADGGSWLKGAIYEEQQSGVQLLAIA